MSAAVVLLDIEKAIYTTWNPGLLHKLSQLQFSASITKLIGSFPSVRKFRVSVEDEISMPWDIEAAIPQVSVLSPTLFYLHTHTEIDIGKFKYKLDFLSSDSRIK
jgi:hypothetical protein